MVIKLLNSNESYVKDLATISPVWTHDLTGESFLELTTPDKVSKRERLIFQDPSGLWHEFIIQGVTLTHGPNGILYQVFAEDSFYETLGDFINDIRPTNTSASSALSQVLASTRWSLGMVDSLGLNSTRLFRTNAKSAIQTIATVWGGEVNTRIEVAGNKITRRLVDIVSRVGQDKNLRFSYGDTVTEVIKETLRDDIITALYGYGKGEEVGDGFGRRIDFASVNAGLAYVGDETARALYGRLNQDGTRAHIFGVAEFDDITDPAILKAETLKRLAELTTPQVNYKAKIVDLTKYGVNTASLGLGDTVAILDHEADILIKARVIKLSTHLDNNELDEVELGNYTTDITQTMAQTNQKLKDMFTKAGVWDRANILDPDGMPASIITGLLEAWNTELNGDGGYVYGGPGEGLITYDKPIDQNPTQAIQILGGAIRIANSKLPGGNWNWTTIGTGSGFLATQMFAGTILADIADIGFVRADQILLEDSSDLQTKLIEISAGLIRFREASSFINIHPSTTKEITSVMFMGKYFLDPITIGGAQDYLNPGDIITLSGNVTMHQQGGSMGLSFTIDDGGGTPSTLEYYNASGLMPDSTGYLTLTQVIPENAVDMSVVFQLSNPFVGADLDYWEIMVNAGSKAMPWTPYIADLAGMLAEATATIGIVNGALETKVSNTELSSQLGDLETNLNSAIDAEGLRVESLLSTKVTQTETDWKAEVESLQTRVSDNETITAKVSNSMTFSASGLVISSSSSSMNVRITDTTIEFRQGNTRIAYIDGNVLVISNAILADSLTVGNHKIEKWDASTQYTIFRYVG